MLRCDKCGSEIKDLKEPCPTCGGYNCGYESYCQNEKVPRKRFNGNVLIGIGILISSLLVIFMTSRHYYEKKEVYSCADFSIEYASNKWDEYEDDDDGYGILLYKNGTKTYVQFQSYLTNLAINLDIQEERDTLYKKYASYFLTSSDMMYTNIMADFKETGNSNLLYIAADYKSYDVDGINGKIYIVHTHDGRAITLWLVLDDTDIIDIDDEVVTLIDNIDI